MRRLIVVKNIAAVFLFALIWGGSARAAAPANDKINNAIYLGSTLPLSATGSNVNATLDSGESLALDSNGTSIPGGASVWYSFKAPSASTVSVSLLGSDFDTVLAVYSDTSTKQQPSTAPTGYATLTAVASNDDFGGIAQSKVTFSAQTGIYYRIQIYGSGGDTGNIALSITQVALPSNDAFANAPELGSMPLPINVTGSNLNATSEPGEPNPFGDATGLSIWWKFTAPATGKYTISTSGSNFDTLLGVYTGTAVNALTAVAQNDNFQLENLVNTAKQNKSQLTFNATVGVPYFIQVDGSILAGNPSAEDGNVLLNIHSANTSINDDFSSATALSGPLPIVANGSNIEASRETGEPAIAGSPATASVWWTWTASSSGKVTISTAGSNFDTVLGVFTGSSVNLLTPIASNDDFGADVFGTPLLTSQVTFSAVAGTQYRIVVDGSNDGTGAVAAGNIVLTIVNPPGNDDFANAIALSGALPLTTTGSNQYASKEAGEPTAGNPGGQSVWWKWTAPSAGNATISTAGSSYSTLLSVYTGTSVTGLTFVSSNGNFGGSGTSQVSFTAQAGQTYDIAVDGINGSSGYILLTIANPPVNDNFAAAIPLSGPLPIVTTGTNLYATKEIGEPNHAGSLGGPSVWWSFTAPATQKYTISTAGSNFDTLLGVYTGTSVAALTQVASNDNFANTSQSQVTFSATANTLYMIAVDGTAAKTGNIVLTIAAPPANDDFINAAALTTALPITANGSNQFASKEPGEPKHAGLAGGTSVWWSWQASVNGNVTISTLGSSFTTLLAVYTGSAVNSLTAVASNVNTNFPGHSQVTISAISGTTYMIAVDGSSGQQGNVVLTITSPPSNDNFANAKALTGSLPITATGSNLFASKEPGEPSHAADQFGNPAGGASVWWTWTAPSTGKVILSTAGSSFDTLLAVYTGTNVVSLTPVASNDNFGTSVQSQVGFNAIANTTYAFAVDGRLGDQGSVALLLRAAVAPVNDDFANATLLSGALPIMATGTNVDASKEPGEPAHAAVFGSPAGGSSVWWVWNSTVNGKVSVNTVGSTFSTLLGIYTGSNVADLTQIGSSQRGQLSFTVSPNTTYYIAVDGFFGATGSIDLTISVPPVNDDFLNAIVLSGPLPISTTGTNLGATVQRSTFTTASTEPLHADNAGGSSVWWSWTAPASNLTTISTFGSDFDTLLAVYTGTLGLNKLVASNNDTVGKTSEVTFEAQAGTTYMIAVDGFNAQDSAGHFTGASQGNIVLKIRNFALPDLQVKSIAQTPASPIPGQTVNFVATIANMGAGDASTFDVNFFMNRAAAPAATSVPDLVQTVNALGGNLTQQVTFTLIAPAPGTYTAWAFADPANDVVESNETNNAGPLPAGFSWTVVPAPSAPVINNGNTVSVNGVGGQPLTFNIPVTGSGPYAFSGNLPAGLSFSGNSIMGTPSTPGTYVFPLTVTNSIGSSTVVVSMVIADPLDLDGDGFPNDLEVALGTDPNSAASTPFTGAPAGAPQPLGISMVKMKLDFTGKQNNDSLQISGFFQPPAGATIAQKFVLDFGGVIQSFTLDSKGMGPKGNNTIKATLSGGLINFNVKLNKGSFSGALKSDGLTGDKTVSKVVKQINVIVLFSQTMFKKNPQFVEYSAVQNRSGSFSAIGTDNSRTGISGISTQ